MITEALMVAILAFAACGHNKPPIRNPDFGLNVKQLVQRHGYPFENHTVVTKDGYILEIHRIPYGRNSIADGNRPPMLLIPGIMCSSVDWVNTGPEKALGFILADRGYDVWLGNTRGTTWSRRHIRLDPDRDKKEFWDYSFHEIGSYDLPAFIEHILNVTAHKRLFYAGHSQGTASLFVLASLKPHYNNKIRLSVALSPLAYAAHIRSPITLFIANFWSLVEAFVHTTQFYEVLPSTPLFGLLAQIFCNDYSPFQNSICAGIFYVAGGYSPDQLNTSLIPVIGSNTPSGSSMKQMQHYAQLYLSKSFRRYDYGGKINLEKYNQPTPPKYDLGKVTIPHLFYYGSNDLFSRKEDVDKTASELPNVIINKRIEGFNHLDSLWGIDAVKLIFNEVLEFMKQF
ncbi:hypothetical protein ILUMI_15772 [Ignelater luminosus]|uniref:Lipase n=1 Tax=Ignelater luminosus TaxID=2038154 RepID=A0A8K0G974_IGNLU|nr:hypothetical protein ILUMI_15772 [Ignelater luminosus]